MHSETGHLGDCSVVAWPHLSTYPSFILLMLWSRILSWVFLHQKIAETPRASSEGIILAYNIKIIILPEMSINYEEDLLIGSVFPSCPSPNSAFF